jgi:thiamine-phosphate pyrophosphorylase
VSGTMDSRELRARLRLIVITDEGLAAPREVFDIVRVAVAAGAPAVQLRNKGASARELAEKGRTLLEITRTADVLFFVNDRLDVALAIGADGVHLGPDDLPVSAARSVVPTGFLIGSSTDDPEDARRLVVEGADYIGCGTVYPTSTKPDAGEAIGLDGLRQVVEAVEVPVVGIGGVDREGAAQIAGTTGAAGAAVVGAVMGGADVEAIVRELMAPWG